MSLNFVQFQGRKLKSEDDLSKISICVTSTSSTDTINQIKGSFEVSGPIVSRISDHWFQSSKYVKDITIYYSPLDNKTWFLQRGIEPVNLGDVSDCHIIQQMIQFEAEDLVSPIPLDEHKLRRHSVRVFTDSGRVWDTEINGTREEVGRYFLGRELEFDEMMPTDRTQLIMFGKQHISAGFFTKQQVFGIIDNWKANVDSIQPKIDDEIHLIP